MESQVTGLQAEEFTLLNIWTFDFQGLQGCHFNWKKDNAWPNLIVQASLFKVLKAPSGLLRGEMLLKPATEGKIRLAPSTGK